MPIFGFNRKKKKKNAALVEPSEWHTAILIAVIVFPIIFLTAGGTVVAGLTGNTDRFSFYTLMCVPPFVFAVFVSVIWRVRNRYFHSVSAFL